MITDPNAPRWKAKRDDRLPLHVPLRPTATALTKSWGNPLAASATRQQRVPFPSPEKALVYTDGLQERVCVRREGNGGDAAALHSKHP